MSAFVFVRVTIHDPVRYAEYMKRTPSIISQYRGKFVVRGGETILMEGHAEAGRLVLIEFPTLEDAKAFYNSPEYAEAKQYRIGAADFHLTILDGCSHPEA